MLIYQALILADNFGADETKLSLEDLSKKHKSKTANLTPNFRTTKAE